MLRTRTRKRMKTIWRFKVMVAIKRVIERNTMFDLKSLL